MSIPRGYKLVPVEPTEEIIRSMLAVRWPATYRNALRFSSSGPATAAQTERDIAEAKEQFGAMLAAAPNPPQPVYDEAKELEKFSVHWKLEGRIYRDTNTKQWLPTRDSIEGFQMAERVHALWLGWESCAKSVEVGHE